jgi:hypothetical protein
MLDTGSWILVASHHGRKPGWDEEFMNLTRPSLSIISGTRNLGKRAITAYHEKSKSYIVVSFSGKPGELRKTIATDADGEITIFLGKSKYHPMLAVFKK